MQGALSLISQLAADQTCKSPQINETLSNDICYINQIDIDCSISRDTLDYPVLYSMCIYLIFARPGAMEKHAWSEPSEIRCNCNELIIRSDIFLYQSRVRPYFWREPCNITHIYIQAPLISDMIEF